MCVRLRSAECIVVQSPNPPSLGLSPFSSDLVAPHTLKDLQGPMPTNSSMASVRRFNPDLDSRTQQRKQFRRITALRTTPAFIQVHPSLGNLLLRSPTHSRNTTQTRLRAVPVEVEY